MAIVLRSGATTDELTVDPASNAGRVTLYDPAGNPIVVADGAATQATQYGLPAMGRNDDTLRVQRTDRWGNPRPQNTPLLWDMIEGSALNTQRWTSTATTMTSAQSLSTGIQLNASAITTINTGIVLTSQKRLLKLPGAPLQFSCRACSTLVANQVGEWGLGHMVTLSGTTAQLDNGAIWRFTSGGTVVPVLIYNGSDVATGDDIAGSLASANYYTYHVLVEDDRATFTCQRSDTGALVSMQTLRTPITQPQDATVTHYNAWLRARNVGSAPASAGQLFITDIEAVLLGRETNKPWRDIAAGNGWGGELSPTAFTQTATFANSAWPTTATLSNTAASYATLGGLWTLNAAASAATDNSFFSFAVPAPYSFYCTGVHISMINTGAANAATPASTLFWGLGANGASANLSTGGHMRRAVGVTSIPASAVIGAASPDIDLELDPPLKTEAGRHLTVIMRIVGGAATASQVWQGAVDIRGYFE